MLTFRPSLLQLSLLFMLAAVCFMIASALFSVPTITNPLFVLTEGLEAISLFTSGALYILSREYD